MTKPRSLLAVGALLAAAVLRPAPAAAEHCLDFERTNLNLLIDHSGSMSGWKIAEARRFGLTVIDELARIGRLDRAGGIGFPRMFDRSGRTVSGFDLGVSAGNVDPLRVELLATYSPTGGWTPLYHAIVAGSAHLAGLPDGRHLLVVVTDGAHSDPAGGPVTTRGDAAAALRSFSGVKYLVFIGNSLTEPGATTLQTLAAETGARFRLSGAGTAAEMASEVLTLLCRDHAPAPRLTARPEPLRLGIDGFEAVFDASASSDPESGLAGIVFSWEILDPGGTVVESPSGTGPAAATWPRTFTDADIGTWRARLTTSQPDGSGAHSVEVPLAVVGAPPEIRFSGTSPVVVVVGETVALRTEVEEDLDGGRLAFSWALGGGPPAGTLCDAERLGSGAAVSCASAPADVTLFSDGSRQAPSWSFALTATDDESESTTATFEVDVENLAPTLELAAPESILAGETLATTGRAEDPDGGPVDLAWEVVQAPDADPDGATVVAGGDLCAVAPEACGAVAWSFATAERDAGTWIFRLTATDDEGEVVTESFTVDVLAPPEVVIEAPAAIGSLTEPLVLDGSATRDPDTPCAAPEFCHTNIDGPVTGVTPGIVRRTWTLFDVPIEHLAAYPPGGVDETFGVPAGGSRVELAPGELRPGEWTFQLDAEDGEGQRGDARVQVVVIDEESRPVAIATPPRRYDLDAVDRAAEPVAVSGAASFDPDNALAGGAPLPGIADYRWDTLAGPACTATAPPPGAADWELFPAATSIAPACHGLWNLRLTVTDDDPAGLTDTAETSVLLSDCPVPVCVDFPTTALPAIFADPDEVDVPILYHVDSGLFGDPALAAGLFTKLEIFTAGDLTTPVFVAFDAQVLPPVAGSSLGFHWTGHRGTRPPRPGVYSLRLSLVDATFGTVYSAWQPESIWIQDDPRVEIAILDASGDAADHLRISRWDDAYGPAPDFAVRNTAGDHFIDRDPRHFVVEIVDPEADRDPSRCEEIRAELSTGIFDPAEGDLEPGGSRLFGKVPPWVMPEPPTPLRLSEVPGAGGACDTGRFRSLPQLLVMGHLSTSAYPPPPHLDDLFPVHDGVSGPVEDERLGDRTHQALIDSWVRVAYPALAGAPPRVHDVPVCRRDPDERRIGTMNFVFFNLPFLDHGYDHDGDPATPPVNPRAGEFDFTDLDGDGEHDPGEPSEPFMCFFSLRADAFEFHGGAEWQARGAHCTFRALEDPEIYTTERYPQHVRDANVLWSPACIGFQLGTIEVANLPDITGTGQHGAEFFTDAHEAAVLPEYLPRLDPTEVNLFVVPKIDGALGYTTSYGFTLPASSLDHALFLTAWRPPVDLAAHELGHLLTNRRDVPAPQTIFFPMTEDLDATGLTDVNLHRRFTPDTEAAARIDRSLSHAVPGDLTSPPPSDRTAPGSYVLQEWPE